MTNPTDTDSVQLAKQHLKAIQQNKTWVEIWDLIYSHPWFQSQLNACVAKTIYKNQLPRGWKDDIQQEAVLLFAREIKRKRDLGFDPQKGDYRALVLTILRRCCLKGIRQFKRTLTNKPIQPSLDVAEETIFDADELFDFREKIRQLPEPGRTIVLAVCHGEPIELIAHRLGQSPRTVYRHLRKSKNQIREKLL